MVMTINVSNYSYVVEVSNTDGEHLFYYRIDQALSKPTSRHDQDRNASVVNRHLHSLTKRTGLRYGIVAEGVTDTVDKVIGCMHWEIS